MLKNRMKLLLLAVALTSIWFVSAQDHCAVYPDCQTCVAAPLCGWCSEPVVYPNNQTGAQCAGFNPNGTTPFACNGIYSTEQCVAGYVCNYMNFTCQLGQPGEGTNKTVCQSNCTNEGQVFLCNETTRQCHQVPAGTPGAASMPVCMASCTSPNPHPVTPSPTEPALFACNETSGECEPSTAGKGTSEQVCKEQCKKVVPNSYMCNKLLRKCVKLPSGIPGGEPLPQCENECNVKPQPGPPPALNGGLWRGVQIDNHYIVGEFDLSVNETTVILVSIPTSGKEEVLTGKPFHIPDSDDNEMWIQITSGPNNGQMIKTISDTSGQPGPETTFMTTAMSAPGGDVPLDIPSSMTDPTKAVLALAKCLTPSCAFELPSTVKSFLARNSINDHCSQFSQSCEVCLKQQFCGWCSTNVTYKDGTTGTQCAGFNGPNSSSPFVCTGRYSTLECDTGYECGPNYQCKPTAPGNGMPQKECDALCHPTPPPTPPPPQYVCNTTTKQCFLCNSSHCAGSMPQSQCDDACTQHKHGPPGNLVGVWRGIRIQKAYPTGEIDMVFTATNMSFYVNGQYQFIANVSSYGADVMMMDILDGKYQGWSFATMYQASTQGSLYEMITMARGILGQSLPTSYDQAMGTPGMEEYVMAKCEGTVCNFKPPS